MWNCVLRIWLPHSHALPLVRAIHSIVPISAPSPVPPPHHPFPCCLLSIILPTILLRACQCVTGTLAPESVLSPFLPHLPQLPALQCDPISGNPSCLHLALHPSLPLLRYWFRKPANPHLMTLCWPLPPRGFRRIGGCGPCHLPALLIIYLVGVHRGLPSTELGKALPSFKSGHDNGLE